MSICSTHFLVLDIETSTLFNNNNEPTATWLSYGYCNLYTRNGERKLECYFRDWDKLGKFLDDISFSFNKKLICFVHNLAYEFDYITKNLSKPKTFLTNSTHAIISAVLEGYPDIEFRCTYKLTMDSLRKLGESIGFDKLDSEYRFILPSDDVTVEEKEYCMRDCDIVAMYVSKYLLKEYGTFRNCPLTKTGRVRKTYQNFYREYSHSLNGEVVWDEYPDEDCYKALNDAFIGGVTTSNPLFTGTILKGVHSYDISSSYPFTQLSEQFPFNIKKEHGEIKPEFISEKFWIAKIKFNQIHSKFPWGWLSISKMNDYSHLNSDFFNGKLVDSAMIIRTVTNIDFEMIMKTYNVDSYEILEFYHMPLYGNLPAPYIKTIDIYAQEKFRLKNELKQINEDSPEYKELHISYMLAKSDFNSIYGMTVQKIMQDEFNIDDNFIWHLKKQEYKKPEDKKHMGRNFLFGVYVTAYARKNLLTAIIENCPYTFVYCDTDSIKFIGDINFKDTNKVLGEKYISKPYLAGLGRFDNDGEYDSFITYGAKKYAHTSKETKGVHITVAGLPKIEKRPNSTVWYKGKEIGEITDIKNFRLGTEFVNCKMGKKYIVDSLLYESEDYEFVYNISHQDEYTKNFLVKNKINTNGGVALFSTNYKLDMTNSDINYINNCRMLLKYWADKIKNETSIDIYNYIIYNQILEEKQWEF